MSKIWAIIPAYNEEKNILKVINDVANYVDKIVVVNDCSIDKTGNVLKEASFSDNIIVLEHIVNRGQGAALQTGNECALENGADIIVHFDADGQFLAEEIQDILKPILENTSDIVFGSRFLSKKSDIPLFKKIIIFPISQLVNRILIGKNSLTDPQSGFRAMTAEAARVIRIEQDRMAHCSEILVKAHASGLRIREVPIAVIYTEYGQKFSGGINIIKDLILRKIG
ncbi:MAG: glycosyltransferase family 2 protein [Candidatus Falkowbacteria bacterium]|nr:glycosyltransferase family 2 protein [Candidatus Falkowbacteria bacterium]